MQRLEHAELLRDHERGMVRKHDPARAEADGRRDRGGVGEEHRGRGAGDTGHVVVLGDPVAGVAEPLGLPCQHQRGVERGGW